MDSKIFNFFGFPPAGANHVPTQTEGKLYVGGLSDALSRNQLLTNKISLVVNTAARYGNWPAEQQQICANMGIQLIHFSLYDMPFQNLFFEDMPLRSIKNYLDRGQNVLVHCEKGASRSVSVVMAYLMIFEGYDCRGALNHIGKTRKWANPNQGFISQLFDLEKAIKAGQFNIHNLNK